MLAQPLPSKNDLLVSPQLVANRSLRPYLSDIYDMTGDGDVSFVSVESPGSSWMAALVLPPNADGILGIRWIFVI